MFCCAFADAEMEFEYAGEIDMEKKKNEKSADLYHELGGAPTTYSVLFYDQLTILV
jgi:hypothetical protein